MSENYGFEVHEVAGQRYVLFDAGVTTGEAYNLTQTSDAVKNGDVLAVLGEGVVGVMLQAWPTAVTVKTGEFHEYAEAAKETDAEYASRVRAGRLAEALDLEVK